MNYGHRGAGRLALKALEKLSAAANIGDFVYAIRESELQGWDGPRVKGWSDGAVLAKEALALAAAAMPAGPSTRPHRCEGCGVLMPAGAIVVHDGDLVYHQRCWEGLP